MVMHLQWREETLVNLKSSMLIQNYCKACGKFALIQFYNISGLVQTWY